MSSSRKLWSYQCEWGGCNKTFTGISHFEAHYRRHTDQRPYLCDYGSCGEAFHDRASLNRHHRIHANERPFACKYESCSQAFWDTETLDRHHRTHSEQLLFSCKYDSCGQAFHDRGGLIEHHRTHKLRPLACKHDSCNRTFARKENLEAHMHMHTRERPFACSHEGCAKSFCDRRGLAHHEDSHVGEETQMYASRSSNPTKASGNLREACQPHRYHHRKDHEEGTTSVKEARPIRLRLSQPKRPDPVPSHDSPRKRIMIRIPPTKVLAGSSSAESKESPEPGAESNVADNRFTQGTARRKASSILTHTVHPQAPSSEPPATSRSTEDDSPKPHTSEKSSVHFLPIYTRVCGIYSIEKALPQKVENGCGRFHCPRCDSQFSRARDVRRHFVKCITKYGNPDSLKWIDHPSLRGSVEFHVRNGFKGQQYDLSRRDLEVTKTSREHPKDATLCFLTPEIMNSMLEEESKSPEPVYMSSERDAPQQKDIVQPICKPRVALRRSQYNPETIARDILLATGSHPDMDPLNAHLDILRRKFRAVNLDSNMDTFRWDVVDPERNSEQSSEKRNKREDRREPEPRAERQSFQEPQKLGPAILTTEKAKTKPKINGSHLYSTLQYPLPSRSITKPCAPNNEAPFWISLPEKAHFGAMSTILSNAFDRDPCARLMSSNKDLRAAISTMFEYRTQEHNFMVRAAFENDSGDLVGWIACHEVDTLREVAVDPLEYLDWMTAAHLLPSRSSRLISSRGHTEQAERLYHKKVGRALASTIQARASEAQTHLVPIRRLVVNALVVHPSYQGRGVASALLKSITEIADMQRRPIWIQAPTDPALAQGSLKIGLSSRAGFICAGELNLDLGSYAQESRERNKGKEILFGTYKWNYLLRWPQPAGRTRDRQNQQTNHSHTQARAKSSQLFLADRIPMMSQDDPAGCNVLELGAVLEPDGLDFYPSNRESPRNGTQFPGIP